MGLQELPNELFARAAELLPPKDIKQLRLVSRAIKTKTRLNITRIFLSPNRTNIDVFRSIVNHAEFAQEIEGPDGSSDDEDDEEDYGDEFDIAVYGEFSKDARMGGLLRQDDKVTKRKLELWGENAQEIDEAESFRIYTRLYEEQQAILESGEDIEALRIGLTCLPSLEGVTLTSEAWRIAYLFPLYETPLFRSLPPGFRAPLPWLWCGGQSERDLTRSEKQSLSRSWEQPHPEWRGYSIVVSELLATAAHHQVREFAVDVHREPTGIGYKLFSSPNEDYNNTLRLFDTLHLTRFDLAINVANGAADNFACFRNGQLKNALSKLIHLEHLHLHTTMPTSRPWEDVDDSFWINLQDIFPEPQTDSLAHLKYIGLANFFTTEENLYLLLSKLVSLQSIDLDTLVLRQGSGTFRSLLQDLKGNLVDAEHGAWKKTQPRFTIRFVDYDDTCRRTVDREVDQFLYHGGECPFDAELPNNVNTGFGFVIDDFGLLQGWKC